MTTKELKIIDENGFHARPAAILSARASKYSNNRIYLVTENNRQTDVKSIMKLLNNAIEANQVVTMVVEGEKSDAIAEELYSLLQKNKVVE